jgi:hypothetical protein
MLLHALQIMHWSDGPLKKCIEHDGPSPWNPEKLSCGVKLWASMHFTRLSAVLGSIDEQEQEEPSFRLKQTQELNDEANFGGLRGLDLVVTSGLMGDIEECTAFNTHMQGNKLLKKSAKVVCATDRDCFGRCGLSGNLHMTQVLNSGSVFRNCYRLVILVVSSRG